MDYRSKFVAAILIGSTVIAGCGRKDADDKAEREKATAASPAFDKNAAEAEIRAGDTAFFNAFNRKDAAAAANMYSEDAVSMPGDAPQADGREAIRKVNEGFLKVPKMQMTGESKSVKFSDDGTMAYATGTYHATYSDAKGKTVTEDGKYLNVLQKVNGKWKIVADAYSSNAPPKM